MSAPRPASPPAQRLTPPRGLGLRLLLACALALCLMPLQPTPVAHAAGFVVTKTTDTADGTCDADCSLREAIIAANNNPGPDTITFAVNGVFAITLNPGSDENASTTGDFDIRDDLTIIGNGPANTIIDGQDLDRVFDIDPTGDCSLSPGCSIQLANMTIRNGRGFAGNFHDGGAIYMGSRTSVTITNSVIESSSSTNDGGGIYATGALSLTNVIVQDNVSATEGGGVFSSHNLTISNSTFLNNEAGAGGGLMLNQNMTKTASISNSTFSGNRAVAASGEYTGGGAIFAGIDIPIPITGSTFSANTSATNGGGLYLQDTMLPGQGTFNLTNNTISGNRADAAGGGLSIASGSATLINLTIAQNHSDNNNTGGESGGGLQVAGGSVTLHNTIVAENYRGSGTATTDNVSGTVSGSNNLLSGAPLLGPLANNGGTTLTHALLVGSPAIDAGNNTVCPSTDQRGTTRSPSSDIVPGAVCDIGAYELIPDTTPPDTSITSAPPNPSNDTTPTFSFSGVDDLTPAGSLTFQCRIDEGAFSPCASPTTFGPLAAGAHTFEVRAVDAAGNIDDSPASFAWTIDTTPPPAPVVTAPANGSSTNNAQPAISGTAEPNSTVTVILDGSAAGTASANAAGNWSFTPPAALGDGAHTVRARASDAVGNTGPDSTSATFFVDTTAPDTAITDGPANPSPSADASFSFSGADNLTPAGSLTFQCQLDGDGFAPCASPRSYSGLADGPHTFQVRAVDATGNTDGSPASFAWTIDTQRPSVGLSSAAPDPTNASPILVTVTFSESVTGFTAADITVANGTVANLAGSGASYTFDLLPSGQGPVTAEIAAGVAQDAAGNPNTAAAPLSRTYDSIAPSVTVEQAASQADPAGVAPINFTVVFDEPVTGFGDSPADMSIGGTAGATTATVTGSGTTYNVAISGMTRDGTVVVTIPAGAAQDQASNPNTASTSADNTVVFDPIGPVVTGIVRGDPSPTNATSVRFTVTFSKPVTGVDASDFALVTSGEVSGASVAGVAGGGATWTVTVATGAGEGTIRLDLIDDDTIVDAAANPLGGSGAGNGDFRTGEAYTIDRTAPTAGGLATPPVIGGSTTFSFTVVFSDNLAIDVRSLDGSDIRVSGPNGFSQLAALVSVSPAGEGTPRTATYQITPPGGAWDTSANGSYTVSLEAAQIFDAAGNPVAAAELGSFQVSLRHTTYLPLVGSADRPAQKTERSAASGPARPRA